MTDAERTNLEAETRDKRDAHTSYEPAKDPQFWLWTWWGDHGRLRSERPPNLATYIPKWKLEKWEERYKLHRGAKPKPAVSPFGGKGLFTAWDPGVILRKRPKVDWVAVTPDLFKDEQGRDQPGCTPTLAASLKIAGYRLHAWESRMEHGPGIAYELSAEGYIGQAESEAELEKCLSLATISGRPKALVGNVTAWTDASRKHAGERGWELILEHYRNEQPWLEPDSRGYPVTSYCFGCYPGAAGRVYLSDYLIELPTGSWSAYLAEELDELDWETIGTRTR